MQFSFFVLLNVGIAYKQTARNNFWMECICSLNYTLLANLDFFIICLLIVNIYDYIIFFR
jgi:hypothetical protein